jgi:hypothetical protein
MPLRIGSEIEKITLSIGGENVEVYYRPPTTSERLTYRTELMRCIDPGDGRQMKITEEFAALASRHAAKILRGVRPGDIELVEEGRAVPLVGDVIGIGDNGRAQDGREHPGYRSDWLQQIESGAGQLLDALGQAVFAVVAEPGQSEDAVKN